MDLGIFLSVIKEGLDGLKMTFFSSRNDHYGYLDSTSLVRSPAFGPKQNVYIYEHCGINSDVKFICTVGKFILKRNCSVGPGFTVITFNHKYNKINDCPESKQWGNLVANDVIVNEEVWIGANVTLCPGVVIGRGCIIAAGSICVKGIEYPPYSIIGGNPAKFIKWRLTLEDQIRQDENMHSVEERIPISVLRNNFNKYSKGVNR